MSIQTTTTGPTTGSDGAESRPFEINVSDDELADLRSRINATKCPDRETDPSQGVQLETIKSLAGYWATDYDLARRVDPALHDAHELGSDIRIVEQALE